MIKIAESQQEKRQLDELLWRALWKPLDLPRDTGAKLALPGKKIELVAIEDRIVIAGLVANWIDEGDLQIRHLAGEQRYRRKSIGARLISKLLDLIKKDRPVRVRAYVRNTSYPFFVKFGFTPASEDWTEHPDFKRHGITFRLMQKYVEPQTRPKP